MDKSKNIYLGGGGGGKQDSFKLRCPHRDVVIQTVGVSVLRLGPAAGSWFGGPGIFDVLLRHFSLVSSSMSNPKFHRHN